MTWRCEMLRQRYLTEMNSQDVIGQSAGQCNAQRPTVRWSDESSANMTTQRDSQYVSAHNSVDCLFVCKIN